MNLLLLLLRIFVSLLCVFGASASEMFHCLLRPYMRPPEAAAPNQSDDEDQEFMGSYESQTGEGFFAALLLAASSKLGSHEKDKDLHSLQDQVNYVRAQ